MAFIALPARAGLALALLLPTACVDTGGPAPDRLAPSLSSRVLAHDGSTVTLPAAQVFAFNEHILLLLATRDDRRVAWIGFHVTEPVDIADSVAIPDSLDALQVLVALNLGEGFAGVVRVSGVARDAAGNRTEQVAIGNPVSVYRPLERPTPTAPLPGPVGDVALDPRRDHVYLAQPESARVLVLSLASMTFEAPIATPSAPTGLDLTASGDSLVVALAASGQLGIAALDPVPREWTLVDLIADGDGRRPTTVRVSAGNKAFVPLSAEETAGAGGVLEYDVATGVVRPRSDFDRQGPVPSGTRVTRTPDRSRIVILFAGPCCPTEGQVYESAPDTVLPVRFIAGRAEPHVSADGTARQFLIDAVLFDQALLPNRRIIRPAWDWSRPSPLEERMPISASGRDSCAHDLRTASPWSGSCCPRCPGDCWRFRAWPSGCSPSATPGLPWSISGSPRLSPRPPGHLARRARRQALGFSYAPRPRQLRLVHLQPRPVLR
jgi:hypothetical protein